MNCDHSFHDLEVFICSVIISRSSHSVIQLFKNLNYRAQSHCKSIA